MAETKQQLTVKEFKMWLMGVEEMQEEDWTPSPAQWRRIREKIESLQSAPEHAATVRQNESPIRVREAAPAHPASIPQSSLFAAPQVAPTGPAPGVPLASGDGKTPVKAPSIDTSDGTYRSPFG